MAKKKLSKEMEVQLLKELKILMRQKKYEDVKFMLQQNHQLIHGLTPSCEVPLVMAIKQWDKELVAICVKLGANPAERHECSKDSRPKIPILIAAEELSKRILNNKDHSSVDANVAIYEDIMRVMEKKSSFAKGSS